MFIDTALSKRQLFQIDSLIKRHNVVSEKEPHIVNSLSGWLLLAIFILLSVVVAFRYIKANPFAHEHKRNAKWVLTWLIATFILFGGLVQFGVIHFKVHTMVSEADLLLIMSTIIALIGAVWAIFARIDAERAFDQAKKTYEAFGDSFEFGDIFKKEIVQNTISDIGQPNYHIFLFLGFPCIGFFASDQGDFKSKEPLREFLNFCNKLEMPEIRSATNFKLKMSILSKERAIAWMDAKSLPKTDQLYEKVLYFYDTIVPLFPAGCNVEILDDFSEDEKLRFIIKDDSKSNNAKASIWVIPDFKKNEGFISAGFTTKDQNLTKILKSLFHTTASAPAVKAVAKAVKKAQGANKPGENS